jgi:hypothetical protein
VRRRGRALLRRRYGCSRGHREAGARPIDEMLEEEGAQTVRAPRMTMREQVEWDRKAQERQEARS